MIVIVTDDGELFFYTDNSEVSFDFSNTEIIDSWTKVKDVSNVKKAYVYRNSGRETIFALNAQGEVFAIGFNDSFFHKISEDLRVVNISSHGVTLILLDEQGDLYQIGPGMMGMNTGFYTKIDKIDNLSTVVKISTCYSQGAAITSQGEVYVWRKEGYGKGKAWIERTAFEKVLDGDWENVIISNYLYVFSKGLARRIDYKSLVKFEN